MYITYGEDYGKRLSDTYNYRRGGYFSDVI